MKSDKKLQMAASAAEGPRVTVQLYEPIYIGKRFYEYSTFVQFCEFQNSGTELLCHNYSGRWTFNLSTAYDIDTASYKANSATWNALDQYSDAINSAVGTNKYGFLRNDNSGNIYFYNSIQTAHHYSGANDGNASGLTTVSSHTNPHSTSISAYSSSMGAQCYTRKSGGGLAILTAHRANDNVLFLRNYASETTTTVSSYSELDLSSYNHQNFSAAVISQNGTKVSVMAQISGGFEFWNWTLSTAFDLSSAGSRSVTSTSLGYSFGVERFSCVNDGTGKIVAWGQYGTIKTYSQTTDGDITSWTQTGAVDRTQIGNYRNGSSTLQFYDTGKKVIDKGYSNSNYIFDSTSNPFGWQWEDGGFLPRGGTRFYTGGDGGLLPIQDGMFNGEGSNRTLFYDGIYSGSSTVKVRQLTTANDLTTMGSYNGFYDTEVLPGSFQYYRQGGLWLDRDNNKLHIFCNDAAGKYKIFDLNANGTFAGTSTEPSYTFSDFQNVYHMQPLTSNGKIFIYRQGNYIYVAELDTAYQPHLGWTVLLQFSPQFLKPNGTLGQRTYQSLYVDNHQLFGGYQKSNKNYRYTFTIDGSPAS